MTNIVQFPIHGTMFISAWTDFVNCCFLIYRYACSSQLRCNFTLFAMTQFPIALASSLYLSDYLISRLSWLVNRSTYAALFFFAAINFLRFFLICLKKRRKIRLERRRKRSRRSIINVSSTEINSMESPSTTERVEDYFLKKEEDVEKMESSDDGEVWIRDRDEEEVDEFHIQVNRECLRSNFQKCQRLFTKFKTSNHPAPWCLRNSLFCFFTCLISIFSGVLKMSGGPCFVGLFQVCYNKTQRESATIAVFVAFWLVTGSMLGTFVTHYDEIMTTEVWIHCGISTLCALSGAIIGSSVVKIVADYVSFLFISINFLLLGIASLVISKLWT